MTISLIAYIPAAYAASLLECLSVGLAYGWHFTVCHNIKCLQLVLCCALSTRVTSLDGVQRSGLARS